MANGKLENLAIIMDGNRRWAKERNLTTMNGHKKGADVFVDIAKYCNDKGLKTLTVYAFSTENWKRTEEEVGYLMKLFVVFLDRFIKKLEMKNIKFSFIGNRERLSKEIQSKMSELENKTKSNTGLNVVIAINYGGREEIVSATKKICNEVEKGNLKIDDIDEEKFSNYLYTAGMPDPDLVVRTSGELRTSNFLPWQIVYSEFLPLEKYWPDFTKEDIDYCIEEFEKRKIRKGK